MPATYNGMGTNFWGCTAPLSDGSYVTTEWVTLMIPMIPIKSFRVRPVGKLNDEYLKKSQKFEIIEKLPALCRKQILHVYKGVAGFLIAFAIALYLLIEIGFINNNFLGAVLFLVIFGVS